MLCAKCGKQLITMRCASCGYDQGEQPVLYLRDEKALRLPSQTVAAIIKEEQEFEKQRAKLNQLRAKQSFTGRYHGMDIIDGELIGYFGRDPVVEVPDTVTRIGPRAFAKTDVERVILPQRLRSIGAGAFSGCSRLHIIVIPENVTEIGEWAFRDCISLQDAVINGRMQAIPESCFFGCVNLSRLRLPDTVKTIGKDAFRDCEKLKNLMLPRNLETIEAEAFHGCSALRLVDVPDSLKSVAANAFLRTAYKTVIASESWKQANGHLLERIRKN